MSALLPISPFDAIKRVDERGEHWLARDLQPLMGYTQWRQFEDAIDRAMTACRNIGVDPDLHFCGQPQEFEGHGRRGADFRLTRFGAYMTAQNGDPRKPEVAAAQAYFAVRTEQAEQSDRFAEGDELDVIEAQTERTLQALKVARAERAARLEAEARLAITAPKAEAWDVLATADGDLDVASAAKLLSRDPAIQTGQRRLFATLEKLGWIFRSGDGHWTPKQAQIDSKRMSILPQSHYHPRTGALVLDPPQVRITVKGLEYLHRHLGGVARLRFHGQQLDLLRAN